MPQSSSFFCVRDGSRIKYYRRENGQQIYIPKSELDMASRLASSKYLNYKLIDLQKELAPIDAYLCKYRPDKQRAEKMLTEQDGYTELLEFVIMPQRQILRQWMQAPFKQNPVNPHQRNHKVNDSLSVRSKSEALIATRLQHYQIPFRYECALELSGGEVYPDFTIRHPVTGETYYWEHLGLLDRPDYKRRAGLKVQAYIESGIIPFDRLLLTSEYQDEPLTLQRVTEIITTYFSESCR